MGVEQCIKFYNSNYDSSLDVNDQNTFTEIWTTYLTQLSPGVTNSSHIAKISILK